MATREMDLGPTSQRTEEKSADDLGLTEQGVSPSKPQSLPDVGLQPWLQVVAGFFLMVNAWGIILSWGTFQAYYTSGGLKDTTSQSAISWIGSIQAFLLLFGGAFGGKWFDAGYFRQMLYAGTSLIVFGMMMTSLSTKYYQILLAQGLCVGCGTGLLLVPSVGLPATWFVRRRGIAVGMVSSGGAVAGIVWPIATRQLIQAVGFGWTARILAFISLGTMTISISLIKQRLAPRPRGSFVEYKALKNVDFALYNAGMFCAFVGFYTFYDFVEGWAKATHLNTEGLPTVYILPVLNAANVFGRLCPAMVADFTGPLNIQSPFLMIAGLLVLLWIPVHTIAPLLVVAILYGFFSGAGISLPPVSVASMTKDLRSFGGMMGVMFIFLGFASLIGPPVTGAIIQHEHGTYDGARIFSGIMMIAGSGFMGLSRMVRAEWKFCRKV